MGAQLRRVSPVPGCSILMTSAPMSASSMPQNGPAATLHISMTRTPCKVVSCFMFTPGDAALSRETAVVAAITHMSGEIPRRLQQVGGILRHFLRCQSRQGTRNADRCDDFVQSVENRGGHPADALAPFALVDGITHAAHFRQFFLEHQQGSMGLRRVLLY